MLNFLSLALKYTFTSPVYITKNFNLPQSTMHHKTVGDMKLHIKSVLNIQTNNSTIDKYISKMFNVNNLNPTYVFKIPDGRNRTLILKNSDFKMPIYPNITNINKFNKNVIKPTPSNQHQVKVKSEEILDELWHEKLIFQRNLDEDSDDFENDNMRKILEENLKSEKDFTKFLNELNEDLEYKKVRKPKQIKNKNVKNNLKKQTPTDDEWSAFGLEGWSGLMTSSKDESTIRGR